MFFNQNIAVWICIFVVKYWQHDPIFSTLWYHSNAKDYLLFAVILDLIRLNDGRGNVKVFYKFYLYNTIFLSSPMLCCVFVNLLLNVWSCCFQWKSCALSNRIFEFLLINFTDWFVMDFCCIVRFVCKCQHEVLMWIDRCLC